MDFKVEVAPTVEALGIDALPWAPATWRGFTVKQSKNGSPHMILTDVDEAGRERLARMARTGDLVDFREAHADYGKLGFPVVVPSDVRPYLAVGDTFPLVGATETVRRLGKYGAGCRVGHVDTPVDGRHPVFAGKTLLQAGTVRLNGEKHGTHTLGTVAAASGIASDAPMITFAALSDQGGTEADVAAGIRWVVDQGAKVVSLSLGGSPSQVIDAEVLAARQRGVLVFSAAGNDGGNPVPGSPARTSSFVVLACDRNLVHASFTDGIGWTLPRRYFSQGVVILAPVPGGGYEAMSGTSMATPHLAALGALLVRAGLTTEQQVAAYFDQHLLAVA